MKKFNLIIKDLETGKEIKNINTNCIIGVVGNDDGFTSMTMTNCTGIEIELAFATLENLKAETRKKMIQEAFDKDNDPLIKRIEEILKGEN